LGETKEKSSMTDRRKGASVKRGEAEGGVREIKHTTEGERRSKGRGMEKRNVKEEDSYRRGGGIRLTEKGK